MKTQILTEIAQRTDWTNPLPFDKADLFDLLNDGFLSRKKNGELKLTSKAVRFLDAETFFRCMFDLHQGRVREIKRFFRFTFDVLPRLIDGKLTVVSRDDLPTCDLFGFETTPIDGGILVLTK